MAVARILTDEGGWTPDPTPMPAPQDPAPQAQPPVSVPPDWASQHPGTAGGWTLPGTTGAPTGGGNDLWNQSGRNPQSFVSSYISSKGLRGAQANPAALTDIVGALKANGVNAALDTRSDGLHKGIMLDGQFVKMLDGYDNWIWMPGGNAAESGGGGGAAPPPANPNGQIFSDPAAALFEQIAKGRLDSLMTPMANPQLDEFLKAARATIDRLNAPIYSDTEEAALRAKVFGQLEQDRAQALQQTMEQMSARGHGPMSGTIETARNLVNKHFDQLRAQQTNDLLTGTIQERQKRLQQALAIQGQMASMTGAQNAQQDARQGQAVTTASLLPNLVDSRLALANGTLGSGGSSPADLMSTISRLIQESQTTSGNSAQMWASIGNMIADALAGK